MTLTGYDAIINILNDVYDEANAALRINGNLSAADVSVDTTNFDGNLSAADDTVQKALETLDELTTNAVWGSITGTLSDQVDLQAALDLKGSASDVALNTTHRTSDGSDHTFIDQDVTTTADAVFNTVDATDHYKLGSNKFIHINGTDTLFVGADAGLNNSGVRVLALGDNAGKNNTGADNLFVGPNAGANCTAGGCVGIGSRALENNTAGLVTAIGFVAGRNNKKNYLTAIGYKAGEVNNGLHNTFIGYQAGRVHQTGIWNTCVGSTVFQTSVTGTENALFGALNGTSLTASYNSCIGSIAGQNLTTGEKNTFLGRRSGRLVTTGSGNVFIGHQAGAAETTVSNKLIIGNDINDADVWISGDDDTGQKRICVGGTTITEVLTVNGNSHLSSDSDKLYLGAGKDMSMYYDGTDGYILTNEVAASDLKIDCGTDKTVELQETVWKDINLGAAQLSQPASSAPDKDEFKDESGTDTGIETYAFDVGEKVSGNFEIQHDYKEGTDLNFHVHFQGIASPTGTDKVNWQLIYTIAKNGETLDATSTITKEVDFNTQYNFEIASFDAISGTGLGIGDQFLFQLSRIAASADEYSGDALIATVGLHYEVDTLGSRQITTK